MTMKKNDASERILIHANEMFMQYGLKSVSMDDIASRLGMSKKTIYQYFADKEGLVKEVVSKRTGENQLVYECDCERLHNEDFVETDYKALNEIIKGGIPAGYSKY
jgi:AcrR family transcriptional regulator